jgi:hypothetical protein
VKTPTTPEGEAQYDDLDPFTAALMSWTEAGRNPSWHHLAQDRVRKAMPLLARALDRAAGMDPDALVSMLGGVRPVDPLPDGPREFRPITEPYKGPDQPITACEYDWPGCEPGLDHGCRAVATLDHRHTCVRCGAHR